MGEDRDDFQSQIALAMSPDKGTSSRISKSSLDEDVLGACILEMNDADIVSR